MIFRQTAQRLRNPRRATAETGFVLPSAIFLLVVLAALGAYMVSLARVSHISSALDIQGGRAYQAARAGIEWAAWKVITPSGPMPCPASPSTLTLGGTLTGFSVEVRCALTTTTDGADSVAIYEITSTATSGQIGEVDRVERQVRVTLGK